MTNDYKEIWDEFVNRNGEQGFFAEAIRSALQLAQEAEQMQRVLDGAKSLLAINADTIEQLRKAYIELYEAAHAWTTPSKLDHALDNDNLTDVYNKAKKVSAENGNA